MAPRPDVRPGNGDKNRAAFCYGTLMAPQVLFSVIYGTSRPVPAQVKQITIRPAVLHKFRRQRVKSEDFPAITPVPNPATTVRGAFISGLTSHQLSLLDRYEGPQYNRQKVKVKLLKNVQIEDDVPDSNLGAFEGEEVEAEAYVWNNRLGELEDKEWDFSQFRKNKLADWLGGGQMTADDSTDFAQQLGEPFSDAAPKRLARETGDLNTFPQGGNVQDTTGRRTAGRGTPGRGTVNRGMPGRDGGTRGRGGRGGDQGGGDRSTGQQDISARNLGTPYASGQDMGGRSTAGRGFDRTASDELRAALAEWKKEVRKPRR